MGVNKTYGCGYFRRKKREGRKGNQRKDGGGRIGRHKVDDFVMGKEKEWM